MNDWTDVELDQHDIADAEHDRRHTIGGHDHRRRLFYDWPDFDVEDAALEAAYERALTGRPSGEREDHLGTADEFPPGPER